NCDPSVVRGWATLFEVKALSPYTLADSTEGIAITWMILNPFCFRLSRYVIASSLFSLVNNSQAVSPNQKKGSTWPSTRYRLFSETFNSLIFSSIFFSGVSVEQAARNIPMNTQRL